MCCDEHIQTSNLNANLETSNEKTRNVSSLVELVVFVKNRFYSRNEECFAADNTTRYIEDKTRRVTQKKTIIGENRKTPTRFGIVREARKQISGDNTKVYRGKFATSDKEMAEYC